jgi:hypothetical protein
MGWIMVYWAVMGGAHNSLLCTTYSIVGFQLSGGLLQEQRSGARLSVSLRLTGLELQVYQSSDWSLRWRVKGDAPVAE